MTQSAAREFASLLPTDADVSAFLDGAEATIVSSRAAMFDYNGTLTQAVPSIAVQFHVAAMEKQPNVQNYTVGKADHRIPSDDGTRFKVFNGKSGLPKDSNGLKFVTSIINAGFPLDKLSDDLSVFENMKVRLRSEALPKTDQTSKDKTIILVSEIVKLPWENTEKPAAKGAAKASTTKAATKPASAAAPAAAANPLQDEAAVQAATDAVLTLLSDEKHAAGIGKAQLGPLSFRLLSNNPARLGATKLLSQLASEFLPTIVGMPVMRGDEALGTVAFDGAKVTIQAE